MNSKFDKMGIALAYCEGKINKKLAMQMLVKLHGMSQEEAKQYIGE